MRKFYLKRGFLFLFITGYCSPLKAEIELNGFSSIRGTSVSSDGGTSPYPGFTEGEFSFKSESLFALQARADLGGELSATVQLYADGVNNFDVEARWAFVSYEIDDQHRLNAGLLANPIFRQSEYEKVGFAHNFARLPKAVYLGFDFSTVEGVSLDSQFDLNGLTANSKILYGNWDGQTFFPVTNSYVDLGLSTILSANASLAGDWWTLFGGVFVAKADAKQSDSGTTFLLAQPGVTAARNTGASEFDISKFLDSIKTNTKDGSYIFAGFNVDYMNWSLEYEYVDYGIQDSVNPQTKASFISIGRRFNAVTLTLHIENYDREQNDYAFLNGVTHPVLLATGRSLKNAYALREFDGAGIDVRWDFHPSAAFKFDYFKGTDTRTTVRDYSIASIGIDLIF